MKPARTWSVALLFLAGGIGFVAGYALNITFLFPAIPFDIPSMTVLCLLGAGGGAFWGGLAWGITGRPWLGIAVSGLLKLMAGLLLVWLSGDRERAAARSSPNAEVRRIKGLGSLSQAVEKPNPIAWCQGAFVEAH
jgi:hypothetical protein